MDLSHVKTMDIKEAAEFLRICPNTLSEMARRGEIPAAKPGKKWVFIDVDLVEWLRSKYQTQTSVSDSRERIELCHFTSGKALAFGGMSSQMPLAREYKTALGLK